LSRFEEILKGDNLGEASREKLMINIEGLHFMVERINQELAGN